MGTTKDDHSSPERDSSPGTTNNPSLDPEKTAGPETREHGSVQNFDATVQTLKPFTTLSALGIAYGVPNTPIALLLILGTSIPMGGSPLMFWGFIIITFVSWCTAMTLSELCSAMPHAGGQYIWVYRLAPPKYRRFLSYFTAMLGWISAMTITASGCISIMLNTVSLVLLLRPEFNYQRWMGFAGFQAVNLVTVSAALFEHALPKISTLMLFVSISSIVAIFAALFAMSDSHATAKSFFTTSVNISGWPNGIAFILGMNGLNWSLSCLDAVTHLAEEIPSPATNIPKALMWSVYVGFAAGMSIIIAVLVNVPSIDGTADNSAIAMFYNITGSKAAAVGLYVPVLIVTIGALWSCQTWIARLAWTLARESGFPLHRYMSRIAPAPFHTPVWSSAVSSTFIAIVGCLYLGSEVAFNSLISSGLLLQYVNYSIPTILLLMHGRSNLEHGPFWYPKLGLPANVGMLAWAFVALVFYCFPTYYDVTLETMNYASVILVGIPLIVVGLWFIHAKKHYSIVETVGDARS